MSRTPSSVRRPKSASARRIMERPSTVGNPPWDNSRKPKAANSRAPAAHPASHGVTPVPQRPSANHGDSEHLVSGSTPFQLSQFTPMYSSSPSHPSMAQTARAPGNNGYNVGPTGMMNGNAPMGPNGNSAASSENPTGAAARTQFYHPPVVLPPAVSSMLPQLEIVSRLQEVVVELSQSAVSEKQRLAHLQQRIDAYAALVKEQDRLIEELRGMNVKLQKERDALIAFRHQSLNHDFFAVHAPEDAVHLEEEERRAAGRYLGQISRAPSNYADPSSFLSAINPETRRFIRSLILQLRDERLRRLEVEEQSSQMIGEQQLTIHRLEDRHRHRTTAATPMHNAYSTSVTPASKRNHTIDAHAHAAIDEDDEDARLEEELAAVANFLKDRVNKSDGGRAAPVEERSISPAVPLADSTAINKNNNNNNVRSPSHMSSVDTFSRRTVSVPESRSKAPRSPSDVPQPVSHRSESHTSVDLGDWPTAESTRKEGNTAAAAAAYHTRQDTQPSSRTRDRAQTVPAALAVPRSPNLAAGLVSVGATYEDATALLAEIRKRHGL